MKLKVLLNNLIVELEQRNFYQMCIKPVFLSGKNFSSLRQILDYFLTPKWFFSKKMQKLIFNGIVNLKINFDYQKMRIKGNASNYIDIRHWYKIEPFAKV